MSRILITVLVPLALLSVEAVALQKPVRTVTAHVENRNRMQTIDEMWAAAAVVIEGGFESSRPVVFSTPANPNPSPRTAYDVRVLEVFKADERVREPGQTITVRQAGGEFDRGSYIERIVPDSMPLYVVGERYILFLRQHSLPTETFYSTSIFSAEGIFKLNGAALEAASKRDWARQLAQQGPDGLRQMLRNRGRGR
jgi:hypothetical protein